MLSIRLRQPFHAALLVLTGAVLMLAHWRRFPWPIPREVMHAAGLGLWVCAIVLFAIVNLRRKQPVKTVLWRTLILSAFLMSFAPLIRGGFRIFTEQSLTLLGMALFITGALHWPPARFLCQRLGHSLHSLQALPAWIFAGTAYVLFLCIAVFLSWYCFAFFPIYTDSESQYIYSKLIASGNLFYTHPLSQFFYFPMTVGNDHRLYSQYQPMHSFILALGQLAHAPAIVNPTLGALTLLVIYALARRIADEATARIAAVLMLGCQFVWFMSAEYMNHVSALLIATLFVLTYVQTLRALEEDRTNAACRWAASAGLCLAALFLCRPLTAVGISLPFIVHAAYLVLRHTRRHFVPLAIMAIAALCVLPFQAWYNLYLTGDMFRFPYEVYASDNIPGFNRGHALTVGLLKAHREWLSLNRRVFEWAIPSTFFVMLACLAYLKNRYLKLLAAVLVSYTAVNLINRFGSNVWGPRYMYEISFALIVLSAWGIRQMPHLLARFFPHVTERPLVHGAVFAALILVFAPAMIYRLPANLKVYSRYFDSNPNLYYSILRQAKTPALVFIGLLPDPKDRCGRYRTVTHANPPFDDEPIIFACADRRKNKRDLIAYYPERYAYVERNGTLYPVDENGFSPTAPREAE